MVGGKSKSIVSGKSMISEGKTSIAGHGSSVLPLMSSEGSDGANNNTQMS